MMLPRLHELRKVRFTDKTAELSIRISVTVEPRYDGLFYLPHRVVASLNKGNYPLALVYNEGVTAPAYPTAEVALHKAEWLLAELVSTYTHARLLANEFEYTVEEHFREQRRQMGLSSAQQAGSGTGHQPAVPPADRL